MTHAQFIALIDDAALVAAIRAAEARSSGEIRVFVTHRAVTEPLEEARVRFRGLGMEHSAQRNGVLVFIAPKSRNFAILGDSGVHDRCGAVLWEAAGRALTRAFSAGQWTAGVIDAIRLIGDELARHFPPGGEADRNELPDEVARDEPPPAG